MFWGKSRFEKACRSRHLTAPACNLQPAALGRKLQGASAKCCEFRSVPQTAVRCFVLAKLYRATMEFVRFAEPAGGAGMAFLRLSVPREKMPLIAHLGSFLLLPVRLAADG